MRASGVFAMGGRVVEDDGTEGPACGGMFEEAVCCKGKVVEEPCIAFSIQLVMCAALKSSALGSWLDGSSW